MMNRLEIDNEYYLDCLTSQTSKCLQEKDVTNILFCSGCIALSIEYVRVAKKIKVKYEGSWKNLHIDPQSIVLNLHILPTHMSDTTCSKIKLFALYVDLQKAFNFIDSQNYNPHTTYIVGTSNLQVTQLGIHHLGMFPGEIQNTIPKRHFFSKREIHVEPYQTVVQSLLVVREHFDNFIKHYEKLFRKIQSELEKTDWRKQLVQKNNK